jgi:glyoxylase-like metal-dependent hydrolase (beta-lactamase superfamily II)
MKNLRLKHFQTGALQTNSYVIYDDEKKELAMIDSGNFSQEIVDFINETNSDFRYLILTHGHGDHIGGISKYKELFPSMKLAAGKNETDILRHASNNYSNDLHNMDISLTPDIFLSENDELQLGSHILKIIETPGHTPGGIAIFINDNTPPILFSGDTLFFESCGRADLYGGDWGKLVASIQDKLYKLPRDTEVYSGHGPKTTIGNEIYNNPYVRPGFNYPGE